MVFVRNPKARRYVLRMIPNGIVRVTVPRGGTLQFASEFLNKNTRWIARQLDRTPSEWADGTEVLLRGVPVTMRISESEGRRVAVFGPYSVELKADKPLRAQIEEHLQEIATPELIARTVALAAEHRLEVSAVSVRNQRSRWGSCSLRRKINLNWRLIQTPETVRDYIIVHELMHLREMNHSARFWAHVEAAFPTYLEAERWLRKNSRLLR